MIVTALINILLPLIQAWEKGSWEIHPHKQEKGLSDLTGSLHLQVPCLNPTPPANWWRPLNSRLLIAMRRTTEPSCFWSKSETTVSTMKVGGYRRLLEKHHSECKPEMHLSCYRIAILKVLLHICPFSSCDWGITTMYVDIPRSALT